MGHFYAAGKRERSSQNPDTCIVMRMRNYEGRNWNMTEVRGGEGVPGCPTSPLNNPYLTRNTAKVDGFGVF